MRRAGLRQDEMTLLAHAGALRSFDVTRRAAWQRMLHDLSLPAPHFVDLSAS